MTFNFLNTNNPGKNEIMQGGDFTYKNFLVRKEKLYLFSKYYIYNRLDNFISFLVKKGNKHLIENSLRNSFINLKVKGVFKKNRQKMYALNKKLNTLEGTFSNTTPLISFYDQSNRWKTKYKPYLLPEKKSIFFSNNWLLKDIEKLSDRFLYDKFALLFKRTNAKYNVSFKKYEYHNKFIENIVFEKRISAKSYVKETSGKEIPLKRKRLYALENKEQERKSKGETNFKYKKLYINKKN